MHARSEVVTAVIVDVTTCSFLDDVACFLRGMYLWRYITVKHKLTLSHCILEDKTLQSSETSVNLYQITYMSLLHEDINHGNYISIVISLCICTCYSTIKVLDAVFEKVKTDRVKEKESHPRNRP
jgi:hypothetical protein